MHLHTQAFLKHKSNWPVMIAFSNFSCVARTENFWSTFRIKTKLSNFSDVVPDKASVSDAMIWDYTRSRHAKNICDMARASSVYIHARAQRASELQRRTKGRKLGYM